MAGITDRFLTGLAVREISSNVLELLSYLQRQRIVSPLLVATR